MTLTLTELSTQRKANAITSAVMHGLLVAGDFHLGEVDLRPGKMGIEDLVQILRTTNVRTVGGHQQLLRNGAIVDMSDPDRNADRFVEGIRLAVNNGLVDVKHEVGTGHGAHDAAELEVNRFAFRGNRPGEETITISKLPTLAFGNRHGITLALVPAPVPEIGQGPGRHNNGVVRTRMGKNRSGNPPGMGILGALELRQGRQAPGEQLLGALNTLIAVHLDGSQDVGTDSIQTRQMQLVQL